MSDPGKAVFLSYASQDAEAAKRICDALRAAGVEVWFDQSELVGGDAWDQKIRKQIKDCALLIPIISENTQQRTEGYFRLEWRLADQRTHLMAKGRAFLLPVVIDDTPDADAAVPDSFLDVQWTRLRPSGSGDAARSIDEDPGLAKLVARVKDLLSADPKERRKVPRFKGQWSSNPISGTSPDERPAGGKRGVIPVLVGIAAVAVVLAIARPWRPPAESLAAPSGTVPSPAGGGGKPGVVSEAAALTAKAYAITQRVGFVREDLATAESYTQRAIELEPDSARARSVRAWVLACHLMRNWDNSERRLQEVQTAANRALGLDPHDADALNALAIVFEKQRAPLEEEKITRRAIAAAPDNARSWMLLGRSLMGQGRREEAQATLQETVRRFPENVICRYDLANSYAGLGVTNNIVTPGDITAALEQLEAAIAIQPFATAILMKANWEAAGRGDLARMRADLDRLETMPMSDRTEDRAVFITMWGGLLERKPERVLEAARLTARSYFEDAIVAGPKAWGTAQAYGLAGKAALARQEWLAAEAVLRQRLRDQPNERDTARLAITLAWLGRDEEAEQLMAPLEAIWLEVSGPATALILARYYAARGDAGRALPFLRRAVNRSSHLTDHLLLLDPWWDKLRGQPEFEALLGEIRTHLAQVPARDRTSMAPAAVAEKSVAVLAFANLSSDKEQEYFSDGISEELLNVLAKIPGLKVAARTSAFYFKGKEVPVPEIAKQLGVAYVVEGSVRKSGDKVRITAQLIKAADGFHVWSDTFTRDLKDIFAVQDEIAGLIAQQLQLKLGGTQIARTVNPEAHRLLLEARFYWNQRGEQNFDRTEVLLKQALAIDPNFAPAHAAMADLWAMRAAFRATGGSSDVSSELSALQASVTRALELDPTLVEPHAARAYGLMMEGKWDESEQWFDRARALHPDDATVRFWHAILLMNRGDYAAAIDEFQDARRLDPFYFVIAHLQGECAFTLRRTTEAIELLREADALRTGGYIPAQGKRAALLWQAGRKEEAVALARTVRQSWPAGPRWDADAHCLWVLKQSGHEDEVAAYSAMLLLELPGDSVQRGWILSVLDRVDEALPYLQHLSSLNRFYLANSPLLDSWRDDPRFRALLKRLNWEKEFDRARAQMPGAATQR